MVGFGLLTSSMMGVSPQDTIYTCLPIFHSAGGGLGVGAMVVTGATLALSRKFSTQRFWKEVITHKATVIQYIGELTRYLVNASKSWAPGELERVRSSHCV